MRILLEQPGMLLLLGALAEAIAIGGLLKTGRKEVLAAVILIPLLVLALVGLERYVVTEREEVRNTIFQLAHDVQQNDLPAVLEHLSDQFPEAHQEASTELPRYEFSEVNVKDNLEIELFETNIPPKATASFNVTVVVSDRRGFISNARYPCYVELTLYKEEGRWLIGEYHHDDAMKGM